MNSVFAFFLIFFGILIIVINAIRIVAKEEKAALAKKQVELEVYKQQQNEIKEKLENKFGAITKFIPTDSKNDICKAIIVFDSHKLIYINNKPYPYEDLLNCKITENVIQGESHSITTIDKIDLANKEFWEGGLFTSRKTAKNRALQKARRITTTYKSPDIKSYTLYINTKDITNPLIVIDSKELTLSNAMAIEGVINAIVANKN
jgi:hypothetical protein